MEGDFTSAQAAAVLAVAAPCRVDGGVTRVVAVASPRGGGDFGKEVGGDEGVLMMEKAGAEEAGAKEAGVEEVNEVAAVVGGGEREGGKEEEEEKDMPHAIGTGDVLPGRWTKEAPGSLPVWEESDGTNGL